MVFEATNPIHVPPIELLYGQRETKNSALLDQLNLHYCNKRKVFCFLSGPEELQKSFKKV